MQFLRRWADARLREENRRLNDELEIARSRIKVLESEQEVLTAVHSRNLLRVKAESKEYAARIVEAERGQS